MNPGDLPAVERINALNTDDVGALSPEQLAAIHDDSRIALVAVEPEGEIVGFCLVVDRGSSHLTPRAAWAFDVASPDLHLERVAFDMRYSGYGLGLALYDTLDERIERLATDSEAGTITLTSLVRVDPPNEHSVKFHRTRGFEIVAEAEFDGVTIGVARKVMTS